jgi:C4-dicarboxylate-specific signal transduction histidine kinase
VGNDITSRVLAEHTVAQQQMKMVESARLSALGASTSTIVHEINNPITVMATGAEQLRSLLDDPVGNLPRMRDICDMIERNNSRIQRIIHGLRSLSREGSHDPFMMASLQTILEETLEVCRERFRQYGVTLRMPDAFPGTEIQCRSPQLCQVLINVLNNAVEAVQHQKDGWVALGAADEGDTITIAVTDSGPGFDAEVREKAFEPFFSTKHEQKGLGLGLSISKNIIEAHNGNIAVDPRCANTRIVITLPKRHTAAR